MFSFLYYVGTVFITLLVTAKSNQCEKLAAAANEIESKLTREMIDRFKAKDSTVIEWRNRIPKDTETTATITHVGESSFQLTFTDLPTLTLENCASSTLLEALKTLKECYPGSKFEAVVKKEYNGVWFIFVREPGAKKVINTDDDGSRRFGGSSSGKTSGYTSYSKPSYTSYSKPSYTSYSKPSYTSYSKPSYTSYSKPSYTSYSKPSYTSGSNPSYTSYSGRTRFDSDCYQQDSENYKRAGPWIRVINAFMEKNGHLKGANLKTAMRKELLLKYHTDKLAPNASKVTIGMELAIVDFYKDMARKIDCGLIG